MWHHVIRCLNPKANYQGDIDSQIHLNVLIPLSKPQSGTDCVREMYQFVCKNSCPSGMNRRPLEVIFTLENDRWGFVFKCTFLIVNFQGWSFGAKSIVSQSL